MDRKKYFVNLQMNEVSDHSVPGNIEYEILANEQEVYEINRLFQNLDYDSKRALSYIVNYFNESHVDDVREEYGENLVKIYKLIYKFGTEETKEKIKHLN